MSLLTTLEKATSRIEEEYMVLATIPTLTVSDLPYLKGKPHRQVARLGHDDTPIIGVYDKNIKRTLLFAVPEEMISPTSQLYAKIVYEHYGEHIVVADHSDPERLRMRASYDYSGMTNLHELWLREDDDVFRIAYMDSITSVYCRSDDRFFEVGYMTPAGLAEVLSHPERFHMATKSQHESLLIKKSNGHVIHRVNNKPQYRHMHLDHFAIDLTHVPDTFINAIYDFFWEKLDDEVKTVISHLPEYDRDACLTRDIVGLAHIIRFYHYPNTVHIMQRMLSTPFWTQTLKKKAFMPAHELVRHVYPNVSKKLAKRMASQFTLSTSDAHMNDTLPYLCTLLDNSTFMAYLEAKPTSTVHIGNALQTYGTNSGIIAHRTLTRFLQSVGVYDMIKRRFGLAVRRYIASEPQAMYYGAEPRRSTEGFQVFSDLINMAVSVALMISRGSCSDDMTQDLIDALAHARTEGEVHDTLMRTLRHIEDEARRFPLTYSKKATQLNDSIDGYDFRLPDESMELNRVGDAMHICVGWGYAEQVRDNNALVVPVYNDANEPVVCIELNAAGTRAMQVKLKYNNIIPSDSPLYQTIRHYFTRHNILSNTQDFTM